MRADPEASAKETVSIADVSSLISGDGVLGNVGGNEELRANEAGGGCVCTGCPRSIILSSGGVGKAPGEPNEIPRAWKEGSRRASRFVDFEAKNVPKFSVAL